ncbi:MAG: OmpA family protein [Proteobacteria bacterium]|nr:OmpA family protein [Pseudomonadota bacterium]
MTKIVQATKSVSILGSPVNVPAIIVDGVLSRVTWFRDRVLLPSGQQFALGIIVLLCFLLRAPNTANAEDLPEVKLEGGLKASLSSTNFDSFNESSAESKLGFGLGGFGRVNIWMITESINFDLQAELLYTRKGSDSVLGRDVIATYNLDCLDLLLLSRVNFPPFSLPLFSNLDPEVVWHFAFGLDLSVPFQGKIKEPGEVGEDIDTASIALGAIIGVGATLDITPKVALTLELRGDYGITEILPSGQENRSLLLMIGIGFSAGKDNDRDRIADIDDGCPYRAEDRRGPYDNDGCPDHDGDGIHDMSDQCPVDLEDSDEYEDEDGCPDPDNDGDTIVDEFDTCPNLALWEPFDRPAKWSKEIPAAIKTLGEEFGGYGCQPTFKYIKITKDKGRLKFELKTPIDGFDKEVSAFTRRGKDAAQVGVFHQDVLDEIAKALTYYPELKLVIRGHADHDGDAKVNFNVGQERANAVLDYLARNKGIAIDRLEAKSMGEQAPSVLMPKPHKPVEKMRKKEKEKWESRIEPYRKQNRRVDFVINEDS